MDNDADTGGQPEQPVTQPEPPADEKVEIPCSCGMRYTFDVSPDTSRFTSICQRCGTTLTWEK